MNAYTNPDRVAELLADRATQGLDPSERWELDALVGPSRDDPAMDLAAAAAHLALAGPAAEQMPDALRQRLASLARQRAAEPTVLAEIKPGPEGPARPAPDKRSLIAGMGWLAAAACAVLAFLAWWKPLAPASQPARSALAQADALRWSWQAPPDSALAGLGGEVVFSPSKQTGALRLANLPALPPDKQYQLWIVDPDRKHPVDGGVFDASPGAATVEIPINAKLRVEKPAAFAITIERRGGVVVSDGPIAAVATAPKG